MKIYKNRTYRDKLKLLIRIYWSIFFLMLIYMVVVTEIGLGDSRQMTSLSNIVSGVIFFGGLVFILKRIYNFKKVLNDERKIFSNFQLSLDERRQYLHDKSGGIIVDLLLLMLLFITCTLALYNTIAFNVSFAILLITIILKTFSYVIYDKIS